ncbi:esterase-like activity of phytase family protein [Oricola cellulosilytica]|uniref:Phytase-like domain-containing protein n=1 Tax=Oricola cellulosilytica TaxID=1429082 RepID=A0A4R0P9A0_9HYPH|nr:esterase-like activity of phytase family protein [Oricola cellulosilytica]TCD13741.1 hypothetical protein E0D97_11580 [Oricola cellulosilytica]
MKRYSRSGRPCRLTLLVFGFFALAPAVLADVAGEAIEVTVRVRPIEYFRIGSNNMRFGTLKFAGGLELYGSSRHFGALSGVHVFDDQSRFIGVTDTGFWFAGTIERDAARKPTGLSAVAMREMSGAKGESSHSKWETDAEGVTVTDDRVFVSFERLHRVSEYSLTDGDWPMFVREWQPPVPLHELRNNKGFETIAVSPERTPLAGALVGISERSLDPDGNIMAFVRREDGSSFEFSVTRRGAFDVTDGEFLSDGDLILLERRFNMQDGVAMRLRRIAANAIGEGVTIDGEILLEADQLYQIDNMEGLAISTDPDGTPRLTIVSDDNHSILQRNLLLEFLLVDSVQSRSGSG